MLAIQKKDKYLSQKDGNDQKDFCESAWESISPFVMTLAYGGSDIYEGWMKNKNSAMISCNDGFRPVSFYIEVLDEKIYQRGDKKFNINS